MTRKFLEDEDFTFDDFLQQMAAIKKMGSLKPMLGMMPGMGQMREQLDAFDEGQFDRVEAMVRSMTPFERTHPKQINGSRRARIARGSGVTVSEVNQLLERFTDAQKMMRRCAAAAAPGIPGMPAIPGMGGGARKGKRSSARRARAATRPSARPRRRPPWRRPPAPAPRPPTRRSACRARRSVPATGPAGVRRRARPRQPRAAQGLREVPRPLTAPRAAPVRPARPADAGPRAGAGGPR